MCFYLLEAGAFGEDGSVDTDKGAWTGLDTSFGVTGAEEGLTNLNKIAELGFFSLI